MRILHVTDCYLPRLGGIEMHVSDLAARQAADRHHVNIMTRTPPTSDSCQDTGPVRVEQLACGPFALAAGRQVVRYVEQHRVDVVHAHFSVASPLSAAALRAASA